MDIKEIRPGVLSKDQILGLIKSNKIKGAKEESVGLSSFDIHITDEIWIMKRGGVKPLGGDVSYKDILIDINFSERYKERNGKIRLERGKTYIFRAKESLALKNTDIYGVSTGKSSIGRVDVLVRVIVDRGSYYYDRIPPNYEGDIFLEVTPISFNIEIEPGIALSQMRLFRGGPELSELSKEILHFYGDLIVDEDGKRKEQDEIFDLRVNLRNIKEKGEEYCYYKAKDTEKCVRLYGEKMKPKEYWERGKSEIIRDKNYVVIEPERFYIFRSKERFKLPSDIAVYAQAVSEDIGEIRIHYAGFVHPLFGSLREDGKGTPLIFEVRGHNVKTILRDGEVLAKIKFYKMSNSVSKDSCKSSHYEYQELRLSNYFKEWDE